MSQIPMIDFQEAVFNIKIGNRSSRTFIPGFRDQMVHFSISEGLEVLRAKLVRFTTPLVEIWNGNRQNRDILVFDENIPVVVMSGHQLCATLPKQSSWVVLENAPLEQMLSNIWNKVATCTPIPTLIKRNNPEEALRIRQDRMMSFRFHFYFFIPKKRRDSIGNRPTLEQRQSALERIHEELNNNPAHAVSRNGRAIVHWQEQLARNPGSEVAPPQDQTMQQLVYVDNQNNSQHSENTEDEFIFLSVEIGGAWTKLKFKKNELRHAVGLPDFDIVDVDIFRRNNDQIPVPTDGERIDSEHEESE
jgi:hypothetical protein